MARKILIISLIFIIAGLVLVMYSDPIFRTISGTSPSGFPGGGSGFLGGGNSTIFQRCRTVTNESVQQCLSQNGITLSGFGRGNGTSVVSSAFGSNALVEGISGIGLIAFGSVLVLVQIFRTPVTHSRIRRYRR